jgi:cell division protein ZapA (FtsZ GTPase activity inhibitor)
MLNLEETYRYADMTALVCLVAIKVTDDIQLAVSNLHFLTLCQADALVALLPSG